MSRRLAAILVADVVGYSRLMEADEAGTLAVLKDRRKAILEPVVRGHGGRVVKLMGDGALIEFASAVKAVEAALELQQRFGAANAGIAADLAIRLRIGINSGDIIGDGTDVYGDTVNIAARLQALAEPGGICISRKIHDEVRGKLKFAGNSMGEVALKNIRQRIEAYRIGEGSDGAEAAPRSKVLRDKPVIAVLPFVNMSGDSENEYFADGLTEDIITALSRTINLSVISRTSAFAYKGKSVDIKRIGQELEVSHLLEGSVRASGSRLRVTAQLIDATTGAHIWSDKFDGSIERIFDIQDEITRSVAACTMATIISSLRDAPRVLDSITSPAHRLALQAHASIYEMTAESIIRAGGLAEEAIALEPELPFAHRMRAHAFIARLGFGHIPHSAENCARALALAEAAVRRGPGDEWCHWLLGWALGEIGRLEDAVIAYEACLAINPNHPLALCDKGELLALMGRADEAISLCEQGMRLTPREPTLFWTENSIATAHYVAGRYQLALDWARRSALKKPDFARASVIRAAAAGQLGLRVEAREAVDRIFALLPDTNLDNVTPNAMLPFRNAEDRDRLRDGLRKAGLSN